MRIFYRLPTRHIPLLGSSLVALCVSVALFWGAGAGPAPAQVLAQKNWAGSGVTVELWWRRAVFYRIDPSRFQDSKGDGLGDLAGVTQRLDYLQSLGADALIVESAGRLVSGSASQQGSGAVVLAPDAAVGEAFDALVREAVGRHLRVLVELGAPASQGADAQYLAMARAWMNQGAAGLYVPTRALEKVDGAEHIARLLDQLRALTNSFPGERVLLADAPEAQDPVILKALARDAQLTASAPIGGAGGWTAAALRAEWTAALGDMRDGDARFGDARDGQGRREGATRLPGVSNPLLVAERLPVTMDGVEKVALERALAAMLLGSRAAVLVEYGQELGLDEAGAGEPLMQWTPTNVTRKPPPPVEKPVAAPEPVVVYKTFHPYVPPIRRDLFPPPVMPVVVVSDEPEPVDMALLPGFTSGEVDAAMAAPNGVAANVAVEMHEPGSLLNLYKQLIHLHHDNATVRSGSQVVLNWDAKDALVWVRRAPAASRTSSTVVVGCNLSGTPVELGDLGKGMRSLLGAGEFGVLAPGAVVVGETR
jgi:hypothetical protein